MAEGRLNVVLVGERACASVGRQAEDADSTINQQSVILGKLQLGLRPCYQYK